MMDLVLAAPLAAIQKVMVDVAIGTAMGDREYAGAPRDGFRAAKHEKYEDLVRAAGAARFEGA